MLARRDQRPRTRGRPPQGRTQGHCGAWRPPCVALGPTRPWTQPRGVFWGLIGAVLWCSWMQVWRSSLCACSRQGEAMVQPACRAQGAGDLEEQVCDHHPITTKEADAGAQPVAAWCPGTCTPPLAPRCMAGLGSLCMALQVEVSPCRGLPGALACHLATQVHLPRPDRCRHPFATQAWRRMSTPTTTTRASGAST